jgi:hypothetical protein
MRATLISVHHGKPGFSDDQADRGIADPQHGRKLRSRQRAIRVRQYEHLLGLGELRRVKTVGFQSRQSILQSPNVSYHRIGNH